MNIGPFEVFLLLLLLVTTLGIFLIARRLLRILRRPVTRDWLFWLAVVVIIGEIPFTARMYPPGRFELVAFAIDYLFNLVWGMFLLVFLPSLTRKKQDKVPPPIDRNVMR